VWNELENKESTERNIIIHKTYQIVFIDHLASCQMKKIKQGEEDAA
jgi:hypothetical protein